MIGLVRGGLAALSAIAALYMVSLFGGALAYGVGIPGWIPSLLSFAAAWWVGRFVWSRLDDVSPGLFQSAGTAALIVGAIGFVGGFFGPIIFTPDANQGPLLGIFITGPLGFLLGGIGGAVRWFVRQRRSSGAG